MKESYKLSNGTTVYVTPETYAEHANEFEALSDYLLRHCRGLHSLDISDVSAGGIQIGGTHNANPGYIILHKTVKYDFSNIDKAVKEFMSDWNSFADNEIAAFKKFTEDGEKYGWD